MSLTVVNDESVNWVKDHWRAKREDSIATFEFLPVPMDYAVSHRPGTRFGPARVLECLNGLSLYCIDKRVDISTSTFLALDAIDVVHDLAETYRRIEKAAAGVSVDSILISIGGDHSITDPILRGLSSKRNNRIGLLVFDAHLDCRPPVQGHEHSGHWLQTVKDVVDYSNVMQIGIGAAIYAPHYVRNLEAAGAKVITPYEMRAVGSAGLRELIRRQFDKVDELYVSVDIDCFDQAYAPGTSVPNPCGLRPHEVLDAIFEVACYHKFIGMDVTEVNPLLDRDHATAHLAAQVILNFAAGVCKARAPELTRQLSAG